VRRAEAIGVHAIEVTLDTQQLGWRPRDLDRAFLPFIRGMGIAQYTSDPVFRDLVDARISARREGSVPPPPKVRVSPTAIRTLLGLKRRNVRREDGELFLEVFTRQGLQWSDLAFLRERTTLPIVLKGIQHPDDARRAKDAGMDGVVVSNHAGRQIDGAIGSLEALPGVVDAVGEGFPVLFDSGVRGGSDVLRALALGASAVQVGRPWVYGMAIAGEEGAREALRNILAEFDLALGLSGHRTIAELSREILTR
jgi:isopentenyl diphosphate isomerase/L-lactate dehydrogenase-like FMN-dependent dehydrogenase